MEYPRVRVVGPVMRDVTHTPKPVRAVSGHASLSSLLERHTHTSPSRAAFESLLRFASVLMLPAPTAPPSWRGVRFHVRRCLVRHRGRSRRVAVAAWSPARGLPAPIHPARTTAPLLQESLLPVQLSSPIGSMNLSHCSAVQPLDITPASRPLTCTVGVTWTPRPRWYLQAHLIAWVM